MSVEFCDVAKKEVRAKDVPKVCDELGGLSLDDNDAVPSKGRSNDFRSRTVSSGGGSAQIGAGGGNTPPLPILPEWWSPECEKEFEAAAQRQLAHSAAPTQYGLCTNDVEAAASDYGATLSYDHHSVAHQASAVDCYDDQQEALQQEAVIEFLVDANGNATNSDAQSQPSAMDHQLHISVDQFPNTVVYPSVVSSSSNDLALSAGVVRGGSGEQQEMIEEMQTSRWGAPSPGATLDMSLEELKTRVRHQLEYYFSRENLAADAYLRSQMDNDQFVRVTTLASFNMVKRLTVDLNLILDAIRESPVLQVNDAGDKVRPIHKRSTLILREIPEGTKKEEVEELFSSPQCPKIVSSEYALNNIWYVNFETDEDAQRAFLYLRQKVQCFKGKPILARIKTAPIPRVQQNGSRPAPPNTLPLQNVPYPAASPSPGVVTGASQILLSPADSCTFASTSTVFLTNAGAPALATASVDNANGVVDSSMTMASSSSMYYYSAGPQQPVAVTPPMVGASSAPMLNSPACPPNPNSFDLGYILAVNGFQVQGAYRPLFLSTAPVSPACQMGPAPGHRFPTDRPPRKPRGGASYSSMHPYSHLADRSGAQSADSGRPPPANRYGANSGARSANGGGNTNFHADRRGSPFWKYDQNYHYSNIRGRPNRHAFHTNYYGGGTGMNTYGVPNEMRPRFQQRGDRGGRYGGGGGGGYDNWNSGNYQPKPRRKSPAPTTSATSTNTTAITVTSAITQEKKVNDSFDLHSSSFPPLPTASVTEQDEKETEVNQMPEKQLTKADDAIFSEQAPTQILQREQQELGAVASPSPVVKVQPRMKNAPPPTTTRDAAEIHAATVAIQSERRAYAAAPKECNDFVPEDKRHLQSKQSDQKSEFAIFVPSAAQKTFQGIAAGRTGNAIPVAVVQPNSQQKQQKVATADKATATDLSPPGTCGTVTAEEQSLSKAGSDNERQQENESLKKLSYADMAKHAATRSVTTSIVPGVAATIQKASVPAPASSATVAIVGGTTTSKGKEQTSKRQQVEKERGKWAIRVSRDSDVEDDEADMLHHRHARNKFPSSLKKQSRSYHRVSEGQQEHCDGAANNPPHSTY